MMQLTYVKLFAINKEIQSFNGLGFSVDLRKGETGHLFVPSSAHQCMCYCRYSSKNKYHDHWRDNTNIIL